MKFTDIEIDLCRKIAEKHRKEIKYGDWFYWEYGGTQPALCNDGGTLHYQRYKNKKKSFPLWTISDCVLWLKERYDDVNLMSIQDIWEIQVYDAYNRVHYPKLLKDIKGKTPLEALLKAVLAVLKEEK